MQDNTCIFYVINTWLKILTKAYCNYIIIDSKMFYSIKTDNTLRGEYENKNI